MSKANKPIKVLRAALKRVQKRWGRGDWSYKAGDTWYVCLEGAITGGCRYPETQAQRDALKMVETIIRERTTDEQIAGLMAADIVNEKFEPSQLTIPSWNDHIAKSPDDVAEVIKLAIIRFETDDPEDLYIDNEEIDNLLEKIKKKFAS